MIYKSKFIELWVNGNKVELENQESLNLRLNEVITDPTKVSSTQASYSFEFEVPATPKNNIIFDYANNLGKLNKFHQRYNAEVYADGIVIFAGTITINSFKDKKYSLNLVSVKVYSLDEIFGDDTMNKIKLNPDGDKWSIEFDGVSSINAINALSDTEVIFPFISYGAFQKSPYNKDDVAKDFTSKFDLDEYNRWYVESFYPSHNMMATLRHAFEWKGYKVGGDAFSDDKLNSIYMSVNLADGQDPEYNIGNPSFGKVDISTTFTTGFNNAYEQELKFPYYCVYAKESTTTYDVEKQYNFKAVNMYDALSGTTTVNQGKCYMFQPDERIIVIPADGFYKVEMDITSRLNTENEISVAQYTRYNQAEEELDEEDIMITPSLLETTPLEIALVRNYDDNYELIKGKHNTEYVDGNPNNQVAWESYENQQNWLTCFPHEDPYNSQLPTEQGDLKTRNREKRMGGQRTTASDRNGSDTNGRMGGQRTRGGSIEREGDRRWSHLDYGYIYNDGEIMAYDQAVSPIFICGFSSLKGGTVSVMKNGYSWSPITSTKNEAFYPEVGYSMLSRQEGTGDLVTEQTNKYYNTYINTPVSYVQVDDTTMAGKVSCMVYLNKNDVLQLFGVQREYHTSIGNTVQYTTTSNVNLKITAFSPRSYASLKASYDNRYEAPTEFDTKLNLANFFNNEKKVSEWVQNVLDAFNLELIQNGRNVDINIKKKPSLLTAVDIDDRVNYTEAEIKAIDYPKSMAVKFKIDDDEWGFERSAVKAAGGDESILNNEEEWKKLADRGYNVITLNDDTYVTSTDEKQLQFSYCWYDTFHWYTVNNKFEKLSTTPVDFQIPVISKYSYMIDGYDYEESMKHDGYGLAQRFWFKPTSAPYFYVWTRTYPTERVNLYLTPRQYHMYLSYKSTEKSILSQYFNINAYLASNYVEVEVYLSAEEYNMIKNGALVKFDSDIYIPVEIQGYDPSGNNPTTLTLMKKVN